jgi:hypothetical protein
MKVTFKILFGLLLSLPALQATGEIVSYRSSVTIRANYWETQVQLKKKREALEQQCNKYSKKFIQTLRSNYILGFYQGNTAISASHEFRDLAKELLNLFPKREKKEKLPAELEKRVLKDVSILNEQIKRNEQLKEQNRAAEASYIVDLRKNYKQHAFLEDTKRTSVDSTLNTINEKVRSISKANKSKPAFYVLLNMYYPDDSIGKINEATRDEYLKKYTQELFQRSLLSSNGILLNVESLIRVEGGTLKEFRTNGNPVVDAGKLVIRYQPFIALGKNLRDKSIDKLIESKITTLFHEFAVKGVDTSKNKAHRGEVLDRYVSEIRKVIEAELDDADFFATETDKQYFTELKLAEPDRAQLIALLDKANTAPKITDNLKDYAGVDAYLKRLFGSYYSKLSGGIPAGTNLKVVTTSDLNTHGGKTAIQLVKEETKQEQTLVLGMHFMKPELANGNVKIRFTAQYGSLFDQYIQDELDNIWKDVRLLEGSDILQNVEKKAFGAYIDVLKSIDDFVTLIRIPESWWKSDKWYAMNPMLAGFVNGILDNLTGLVQLGVIADEVGGYIHHFIFQATLYAHELSKNEEKKTKLFNQIKYIQDNWFPIARKMSIQFITVFSSIDFLNTSLKDFEGFFHRMGAQQQLDHLSKIEQATTLSELATGMAPFVAHFLLDIEELKLVAAGALMVSAWEKLKEVFSDPQEVNYYTGYGIAQFVSSWAVIGQVAKMLKAAKVVIKTTKALDEVADSFKALSGSGKLDDVMVFLEDLIRQLQNTQVDEVELNKLKQSLKAKLGKKLADRLGEFKGISKKLDAFNDAAKRQQFLDDFAYAGDDVLRKLDANEGELVDSWKVFNDANLSDARRKNPADLERLSKALRQNGYNAAYFENLLKSKLDPQKFIDDYVSKLGNDGKFVDNALETDYARYVSYKSKQGKTPRDRADWNEASDYFKYDSPIARGNAFNETARIERWYPFNEVVLSNGKRVDSYRLPEGGKSGEIVSRKATDLGDIQLSTFEAYLSEMKIKYAPGTPINSPKYGDLLKGKTLEGDMILELPDSNLNLLDIQDYINLANSKGITLRFKPE